MILISIVVFFGWKLGIISNIYWFYCILVSEWIYFVWNQNRNTVQKLRRCIRDPLITILLKSLRQKQHNYQNLNIWIQLWNNDFLWECFATNNRILIFVIKNFAYFAFYVKTVNKIYFLLKQITSFWINIYKNFKTIDCLSISLN